MAGYSGTPLPQKLGIKPEHRVTLLRAPHGFALSGLPPGVTIEHRLGRTADVLLFFVSRRRDLERSLPSLRRRMAPTAGLWIAWPKKASGVASDVNDNVVRELALPSGLVDNKVCAIDGTWSGLRLVIRVALRP